MRISDWSSDVCSSDLLNRGRGGGFPLAGGVAPDHAQERLSVPAQLYLQRITRQRIFSGDLRHLELETTIVTFRARFLEQRRHGDREAVRPGAAGVLASNPVQPALSSRSEEHTSELQSLMRISYAVFCLQKKPTRIPSTARKEQISNKYT